MSWKAREVVSQRIEFVIRAVRGEGVSKLCREYGISRETGHVWLKRYREAGSFTALQDRSRAAHRVWNRTDSSIEGEVLALRREQGWAGRKIQCVLKRDLGIEVSARTVDRILNREGCIDKENRHRPALKRFQREEPNQLWQMDFKGQYPLADRGHCFPLTILDDHSRYLVGLFALTGTGMEDVRTSLITTFHRVGVPDQMLMDHGCPWWNTGNERGLTQLSVMLMKQGIRLSYSGVGHPQTQGKVERFHRTLSEALKCKGMPKVLADWQPRLDEIRHDYNQRRPHEALQMQVPSQKYRSGSRAYADKPMEWKYPEGLQQIELNSQGSLDYGGHRYFISRALAKETVALQNTDSKLLVRFRHMYIREVDLRTAETRSLIAEADDRPVQTDAGVEKQKTVFPTPA
jgi:transposase InsO family protein